MSKSLRWYIGIFILLNIIDIISTLGQKEGNPLIAIFLNLSPQAFTLYKIIVTTIVSIGLYLAIKHQLIKKRVLMIVDIIWLFIISWNLFCKII